MIDVKKLIFGFLILAAAAVGSGFILSYAGGFISAPSASAGPTIGGATGSAAGAASLAVGETNAFVDTGSVQGNAAEILQDTDTTSTDEAASSPTNLTNEFANSVLNGLVSANPDGVSMDASGNLDFNAPDTQSVAQSIASDPALAGFTAPNWDLEAQSQVINIEKNAPSDAVSQYDTAIQNIFNQDIVATNLQSEVNNTNAADPTGADYVAGQLKTALSAIIAVPTPTSLVPLQTSLVRMLVYEENTAETAADASDDPVKAALTMQAEQAKYSAAISELQGQEQGATSQGVSLFNNSTAPTERPFLATLFAIPTANAQWITFDPTAFAQLLEDYVEDIILQILKNTLVALIQKKVLTWIQGSGAPRFVQSFATQMVNSFQTAAVNAINSDMECVPANESAAVQNFLTTPSFSLQGNSGGAGANNFCSAEFNSQINNNLQGFVNHFDNFGTYMNLFLPGGNAISFALQARDGALTAGISAQSANQTKTIAQQGWSGSEVCDDGSNPQGTKVVCQSATDPGYTYPADNGACDAGDFAEHLPNDGVCSDGTDPTITTPGQVTGQGFFTSLKSGVENITSADNIAGILDALLTSLLNTLAQNAINYSNQAVNGALNGGGGGGAGGGAAGGAGGTDSGLLGVSSSTITGGGGGATVPAAPITCTPPTQNSIIAAGAAGGGETVITVTAGGGAINSTCAVAGNCPAGVNSDGTPTYTWNAPGSIEGISGIPITGSTVSLTYTTPGTYAASVTASTDNTTATCNIVVQ
jgi:hypothetical protein